MAVSDLVVVSYCNITPRKIVCYTQLEGGNRRNKKSNVFALGASTPSPENESNDISDLFALQAFLQGKELTQSQSDNLNDVKYKSVISPAARRRLTDAINWLYVLSKPKKVRIEDIGKTVTFRISLLTLTLSAPQMHTDAFIKAEMLNRMLEYLRYNQKMSSYIWRAEIQTKSTDNIHFHITTNVYIHYMELRNAWNAIQAKYGYIDAFEKENGHRNPNSTDVHGVYKVKNLAAYLCKYMAKECEGRPISGRQWFLSTNLSKIKPINLNFDGDLRREVEHLTLKKKNVKYDYATVFYADVFTCNLKDYPELRSIVRMAYTDLSPLVN